MPQEIRSLNYCSLLHVVEEATLLTGAGTAFKLKSSRRREDLTAPSIRIYKLLSRCVSLPLFFSRKGPMITTVKTAEESY